MTMLVRDNWVNFDKQKLFTSSISIRKKRLWDTRLRFMANCRQILKSKRAAVFATLGNCLNFRCPEQESNLHYLAITRF